MGWNIGLIKNTVEVPTPFAEKLFEIGEEYGFWYDAEDVIDIDEDGIGHLTFDSDHGEHMDYLHYEEIQNVLLEAKVNGVIAFASVEGDNAGTWWSYEFTDGELSKKGGKLTDLIA